VSPLVHRLPLIIGSGALTGWTISDDSSPTVMKTHDADSTNTTLLLMVGWFVGMAGSVLAGLLGGALSLGVLVVFHMVQHRHAPPPRPNNTEAFLSDVERAEALRDEVVWLRERNAQLEAEMAKHGKAEALAKSVPAGSTTKSSAAITIGSCTSNEPSTPHSRSRASRRLESDDGLSVEPDGHESNNDGMRRPTRTRLTSSRSSARISQHSRVPTSSETAYVTEALTAAADAEAASSSAALHVRR
jgi:hypothetical protein